MLIKFNVKNQKLEVKDSFIANKSNNYLELKFNFKSNDWDDKTKFNPKFKRDKFFNEIMEGKYD